MRTRRIATIVTFVATLSLFLATSFTLAGPQERLTADNPNPPASTVKLIFIHHSVGDDWLSTDMGNLGNQLGANNYYVSDTYYEWGPDEIGSYTDIGNWWDWFRGPSSATYTQALYNTANRHAAYIRPMADPGGENQIVLFKSCYPNSHLGGNPNDPPTTGPNPLRGEGYSSEHHTVGNAKGIYNDILEYFRTRQDKLFVVITAPPLMANETDAAHAANARAFNTWLVEDWLDDYPYNNVAVFDYYNVLTSNGSATRVDDPETNEEPNDADWGDGNHHRWRSGAVQYRQDINNNYSAYPSGDSHPTTAGHQKATGEFVQLLNVFYHRWKEGEVTRTPTATPTATIPTGTPTPTVTPTIMPTETVRTLLRGAIREIREIIDWPQMKVQVEEVLYGPSISGEIWVYYGYIWGCHGRVDYPFHVGDRVEVYGSYFPSDGVDVCSSGDYYIIHLMFSPSPTPTPTPTGTVSPVPTKRVYLPLILKGYAPSVTPTPTPSPTPTVSGCPAYPSDFTFITDLQVYAMPDLTEPAPRQWFTDPTFGTCLVRVTDRANDLSPDDDSTGLVNEYARVQSFNADGSRLLAHGTAGTWYLYDAQTLLPLGELPLGVEPRWDADNPNLIYYSDWTRLMSYNVQTAEQTEVHDFANDFPGQSLAAVWTRYEGSPSRDRRYWGLMAEDEDWIPVAFLVYDRQTDQVTIRDMRGVPGIEDDVDHVTMSPLGTYFIASFDRYCESGELGDDAHPCGLMVYNRDLTNGRGLLRIIGHYDPALDAQGREVIIYQDIDTDHISMLDLASGAVTPLWEIDFSFTAIGLHFSGLAFDRPGWAVVSTYDDDVASHTWMDDQVFLVELKPAGRVVRLAHTHSLVDESQPVDYYYWAEPHASANPDLTRVLFTTNWGRFDTGEVEMFMIALPPDWPERLP